MARLTRPSAYRVTAPPSLFSNTWRGGSATIPASTGGTRMNGLSVAGGLLLLVAPTASEPPAGTVAERFGWLAGCWGGERGASAFREVWTVASPDLMIGMGVTTQPGRPLEFEYLRIEARTGGVRYVAQPGGAPPTAFDSSAEASTADTTVFANPQHDFPKRIGYRRGGPSSLLAWIDGGAGEAKRIEFPMRRTACPGGDASR